MTPFLPTISQGLDWTIRASLLFAAAFLITVLLRRRSAAIRHFIWSGALVGSLLLPLVMSITPSYRLPAWSDELAVCPGGLFEPCVKVASAFLESGTIATLRGRKQPEQKFEVHGSAKYSELPLVVLVDGTTASAGEVLAAALQDHNRAIVIGERTFGKGSVQSLIPVDELNANLKLTTAQIFRANGTTVNRSEKSNSWGVNPNDGYYIPVTDEQRAKWHEQRTKRDLTATTLPESLTRELILSELADPALAAAEQALAAKLETGAFQASGRPLAEMQQQLETRGKLEAERKQLLEKLQQIDQQLSKAPQ